MILPNCPKARRRAFSSPDEHPPAYTVQLVGLDWANTCFVEMVDVSIKEVRSVIEQNWPHHSRALFPPRHHFLLLSQMAASWSPSWF